MLSSCFYQENLLKIFTLEMVMAVNGFTLKYFLTVSFNCRWKRVWLWNTVQTWYHGKLGIGFSNHTILLSSYVRLVATSRRTQPEKVKENTLNSVLCFPIYNIRKITQVDLLRFFSWMHQQQSNLGNGFRDSHASLAALWLKEAYSAKKTL